MSDLHLVHKDEKVNTSKEVLDLLNNIAALLPNAETCNMHLTVIVCDETAETTSVLSHGQVTAGSILNSESKLHQAYLELARKDRRLMAEILHKVLSHVTESQTYKEGAPDDRLN